LKLDYILVLKKFFNNLNNIKHNGCFFHFLKNIRKYLIKNGFTKKENETHYKYIITNVYKLPFKNNIDKNIYREINKICKKNKKYNEFKEYFTEQWIPYFKNKILVLKDIDIKFRTNNSIENFNRYFRYNIKIKENMNLMSYVDNLLAFNNQQIKYFKENINKNPKTISNENINKIIDNINEEEIILKEIEAEYDNQISNTNNNYNISNDTDDNICIIETI